MRQFFHGWRRKAGCGLLVLALLMAGAWFRSRQYVDYVEILTPISNCLLLSGNERLLIATGKHQLTRWFIQEQKVTLGLTPINSFTSNTIQISWYSYRASAVHVRPATHQSSDRVMPNWPDGDGERERPMLPYWAVVLPIAIVSACLLLWKPRRMKLTTNAESGQH